MLGHQILCFLCHSLFFMLFFIFLCQNWKFYANIKFYAVWEACSNQALTTGNTEFSAHVASDVHEKEDLEFRLLCTDDDWYQRGVKEAIAIRKLQPTLNQDDGRHHLSAMYSKVIRSSHIFKDSSKGANQTTVQQN